MGTTEPVTPTAADVEQVTRAKLVEDLRTVFADVEDLLKATANQSGERITVARAKAEESLKVARARLVEVQAAVAAQTKAAAKLTDDSVRANPWQAVGISAAVGLILGMLITRR
jgi:ElaB/YqjD/DUF883 family membrane-anchored ribosome-binding protein